MAALTAFQIAAIVVASVASVASFVVQQQAAKKAASARAQAARERKEAKDITKAGQENVDRTSRRRAIREERIRRARIIQGAVGAGAGGSSAQLSAPGIIGTATASAISAQTGGRKAAAGVTDRLQNAADFEGQANKAIAQGQLFSSIATTIGGLANQAGKLDLFNKKAPKDVKTDFKAPF